MTTETTEILDTYKLTNEAGDTIDIDDEEAYAEAVRESLATGTAEGWIRSERYGHCYAREC